MSRVLVTPDTPRALADIYDALGITDTDHMSICWKPNGTNGEARMRAKIHTRDTAPDFAGQQTGDTYFGINPVDLPVGNRKRGTEKQVTRVVALHADLDVKKDACPDIATAHEIIDRLSDLMVQRPVGHILSGGGVQPLWAVIDCDDATGRALIRRWGRLVKRVCRERNIKADGVFEVSRILRVPGTLNHKYQPPRAARWVPDTGQPMTPEHVTKCLDSHDVTVMEDDTQVLSEVISAPSTWTRWRNADDCSYASKTVDGWASDTPSARHPWMMSALTRLACMQRNGCLSEAAVADARRVLERRYETLCATGDVRDAAAYRFDEFWDWAVDRASRKTEGQVKRELGNRDHKHQIIDSATLDHESLTDTPATAPKLQDIEGDFWTCRESLKDVYSSSLNRMCAPWGVLAHCVARALAAVPYTWTLPPVIGGRGSLNWFAGIATKSGGGKSGAARVSRELIRYPLLRYPVLQRNLGAGEGMVDAYRCKVSDENPEGRIYSVMFVADEIDTVLALKDRGGSTLFGQMRGAFTGEGIGFAYRGNNTHIEEDTYRMTVTVNMQPRRSGWLVKEIDGGTMQRFMWFPGNDSRVTVKAAQTFHFTSPLALPISRELMYPRELKVPEQVTAMIREEREKSQRGEQDDRDSHALFIREKFAFALAVLDGRIEMSDQDWDLAGIAMKVSDWVRDWVTRESELAVIEESEEKGRQQGIASDEAALTKIEREGKRTIRIQNKMIEKLAVAGDKGLTMHALTHQLAFRDRPFVPALAERMEKNGLITIDPETTRIALVRSDSD